MAEFDFKGYDNFVLENKIESILATKLDMNRFMTADYSLAEAPGMVKKIHRYSASGEVDDLTRGEGNTHFIDAEYSEEEYRVARDQGQIRYYDDDVMTDPVLIDTKVQGLSESMVNAWTKKAIAEYGKTDNMAEFTNWGLADWADAIAIYSNKFENQEGLFCLASMDLVPQIRKSLGDYLKYTEAYIRTGAIGEVLGVPIYTSKALPKNTMFIANKDAVHAFIKKGVFVEQDRDIDTKLNNIVATRYSVIALVDDRKCIMCGKAQSVDASVSTATKATYKIAGAATTGAKVHAFVNGVEVGTPVVAASNAYEITIEDALVAGDKVKVRADLEGFIKSYSDEFVVAA